MKKRAQAMIMAALMIAALATSCSQPAQEGASSAAVKHPAILRRRRRLSRLRKILWLPMRRLLSFA